MTDLAITAANIEVIKPEDAEIVQIVVAETVTAGQPVFINSDGQGALADANASGERQARALTLQAGVANQSISCLKQGYVEGFTLSSQAFDDPIFLSDTVGVLGDSAGTVTVPVGLVAPIAKDASTISKVLYLRFRWGADYT
ncbi:hypothetical protein LCGC14_1917830 [marine sediment metagenome]|uniref:Uncharacterized protein n=1 Tax=marine sediment metagenome TaxID=412755 RepID=A0A0F9FRH5_9ZZZZ